MSALTMTDLFCGGGGSSTGATQVRGVRVRFAANHWPLAIATHNQNHPGTDHAAVDLHQGDPGYFPRTDLLWASPECTKWSQASGVRRPAIEEGLFEDPASDDAATRSRLLMFDVLRFAAHHRYRAMIVENVIDIATQARYALAWTVWRQQLRALGYRFRVVSLNSMHAGAHGAPAPQSRDRIYVVCWREGEHAPDVETVLRPRAWCPRCARMVDSRQSWKNGKTVGRYRQSYLYVHGDCGQVVEPDWLPAAAAIDWSITGERIGDRTRPLADKTRLRIAGGIARYWGPLHIEATGNQYDAADPAHPRHGDPNAYYRAWPISEAIRTLNTRDTKGLVTLPFITEMYGTSTARPVTEPAGTFTAGGNHHGLVTPTAAPTAVDRHSLVHRGNTGGPEMTTPVFAELATLTAAAHQSLPPAGAMTGCPRITPTDLHAAQDMVDDVTFRMFRPHEVAAGMAFPPDYKWDATDPRTGRPATNTDLVKMAGNAVTPPAARDLVAAVAAAITGEVA